MKFDEKLRIIAQHYKWDMQSVVCMEECAELIQAISKYRRAQGKAVSSEKLDASEERKHVIEELADVLIMALQLSCLLQTDDDELWDVVESKIDRQMQRIHGKGK